MAMGGEIKMYDPTIDYHNHKNEYDNIIQKILNTGHFIMGAEVAELEKRLAEYVGVAHCIAVSNGTDALMIALMALGVGVGDYVITTSFTWISTAEVISLIGAIPLFVDIQLSSYNMDTVELETVLAKYGDRVKAIIPVSLFGLMTNMRAINLIAEKYGNIPVIEDGAQSFGAFDPASGRKSCSMSVIGTTSFFPSKTLGCYGDGGACFTDDGELATWMRAIRTHGGNERYKHYCIGTNARLDTLQAGILLVKMAHFEEAISRRRRNAAIYQSELAELEEQEYLLRPTMLSWEHTGHVYGQYTIYLCHVEGGEREKLIKYLSNIGIQTAVFYPMCLHTQEAFHYLNYGTDDFPMSRQASQHVLSLPCYPEVGEQNIYLVCNAIKKYYFNLSNN